MARQHHCQMGKKHKIRHNSHEIALLISSVVCVPFTSGVCALLLCLSEVGFNGWQKEQLMWGEEL